MSVLLIEPYCPESLGALPSRIVRVMTTTRPSHEIFRSSVIAGALAGVAGLVTFLVIHARWIVPIWFVAPFGLPAAAAMGAVVGVMYAEIQRRLPPRPWRALALFGVTALMLLPAIVLAQLQGPILTSDSGGGLRMIVPAREAIAAGVEGLIVTVITGATLGFLIGMSRRAAFTMALAGAVLALGPGHNIPVLGGTASVAKELGTLAAVTAVAASVLVEVQSWLTRRPGDPSSPGLSSSRMADDYPRDTQIQDPDPTLGRRSRPLGGE